jgi:phage terminase large subunit GpA-like protein
VTVWKKSMRDDSLSAALASVRLPDSRPVWKWAADEVDFSRCATYETELKTKYSPDYLPYFNEIQDAITDRDVSEVWVLKNSRAGATENCILNPIRWAVARGGYHILFVSGNEDGAIDFFEKRIKDGLKLAKASRQKLSAATRNDRTRVYFPDGNLTVTWPRNRMAFKASGYNLIFADEVSIWSEYATDMLRKRGDNWAFSKIIGVSSPDPGQKRGSDDDPIFVEYTSGDRREWRCRSPNRGNEFVFTMGDNTTPHGLKWGADAKREDGTWNLDRVYETAHFVCPDGDIIHNRDRMNIVRGGRWVPTTPQSARSGVRSYHVNSFMSPFKSGDFGAIAVAFLKANAAGPQALRTFVYEYLAEPWYGEKQVIEVASVDQRRGSYRHGQRLLGLPAYEYLTRRKGVVLMTVDVQKSRFFVVVREWFDGGDSALIEFAEVEMWKDLAAIKAKHNAAWVFVDLGYTDRRNEVLEQSLFGDIKGAVPMFGRDTLKEAYHVKKDYDPFEGTAKQGRKSMPMVTFNPDAMKTMLSRLMDGTDPHQWLLPTDILPEYIRQVTAEECIDGAWVARHKDNHGLDCEVMNLVGAMVLGVFRQAGIELSTPENPPQTPPQVAYPTRRRGVYVPD